jgi:hypothetical protein
MIINSTSEWHWMPTNKHEEIELQLTGWEFDMKALRESEGVSPLSTKSPRANSDRLINEISSRL